MKTIFDLTINELAPYFAAFYALMGAGVAAVIYFGRKRLRPK